MESNRSGQDKSYRNGCVRAQRASKTCDPHHSGHWPGEHMHAHVRTRSIYLIEPLSRHYAHCEIGDKEYFNDSEKSHEAHLSQLGY